MRLTGEGVWESQRMPMRLAGCSGAPWSWASTLWIRPTLTAPRSVSALIAEALYPYPKNLVIATKGGLYPFRPNRWAPVGRPEYLTQCVEMSLRRLKVERIDLYQLHRIDPKVPVAESLGALADLQKAGKIRHIGLSEVGPDQIEESGKTVPIVSVQDQYNIGERSYEKALAYCEQHKLAFIPWFPMAAGKLARSGGPLDETARRHKTTVAQLAVAWLLHRSPVMLPIPGTSSVKHLEENVAAASIRLSPEEWQAIERDVPARKN